MGRNKRHAYEFDFWREVMGVAVFGHRGPSTQCGKDKKYPA